MSDNPLKSLFSAPKPPAIVQAAPVVPTEEDPAVARARRQALLAANQASRRRAIATSSQGVTNPVAPIVTRLSGIA